MRGRWTLTKEFTFEAAHRLDGHDGKCARLHGHSFKLTVFVSGSVLHRTGPQRAMLMDFGHISDIVKPFIDQFLDHHFLNETLFCTSPTSEFLAQYIYEQLQPVFDAIPDRCKLTAVMIGETCTSACHYMGADEEFSGSIVKVIEEDIRNNGTLRQLITSLIGGTGDETLRSE